jgi:hypothetical protein
MSRRDSAYCFDDAAMALFNASLEPLDSELQILAVRYRLEFQSWSDKGWPGRTLWRRRGFKTYFLRVSLEWQSASTDRVTWEIDDVWMYDYGELFRKVIAFNRLASGLDSEALANGWPSAIVAKAVERNFTNAK